MHYYQISKLVQSNGTADYKGLDISLFIAGSQVYDFSNNLCLVQSNEEKSGTDITVLTEAEYLAAKDTILATRQPTELEQLQTNQALIQAALDDIILNMGV